MSNFNEKMKRIFALIGAGTLALSLGACGGGGGGGDGDTVTIKFAVAAGADTMGYYSRVVSAYNEGQGKTDGVYVNASQVKEDYSSNMSSSIKVKNSAPHIVIVKDKYFKKYTSIAKPLLQDLSGYVADETTHTKNAAGEKYFSLADISANNVYRWRYDKANNVAGGESGPMYGIPNGSDPTVIVYNKDYFEQVGVNIISVAEEDLAAYNTQNSKGFKPHGYAEYTVEYANANGMDGLQTSQTLDGQTVVKVFNDRIAMNWSELVNLSRYLTKGLPSKGIVGYNDAAPSNYGFVSEWWFSYGWSVGGDCIKWDEQQGKYLFTLGDEDKNYLVTQAATVNGEAYTAGEVLEYNDMKYVRSHLTDATVAAYLADGTLTEIASQYEAFQEFTALTMPKNEKVSETKNGYGVAPNPDDAADRTTFFSSGSGAMLCAPISNLTSFEAVAQFEYGIAPCWQYREYEGGDVETDLNGTGGYLKKIGKDYAGVTYTGDLRVVNGTPVVGTQEALSMNTCYAIPSVHDENTKLAAWKFIQYIAGLEGQKVLAESQEIIPNQMSYATSAEYLGAAHHVSNIDVAVKAAAYSTIIDSAYVESGEWVQLGWASDLNTKVRKGLMTLEEFFSANTEGANATLEQYKVRLLRR